MVHADGAVISGRVSVNQSALNGESRDALKTAGDDHAWDLESAHKLFCGSVVVDGEATMRVGRVGGATYYGMVARDVQSETRESPLKHRLSKFATQISRIGYVMAAIVGFSYLFGAIVADNEFEGGRIVEYLSDYKSLLQTLIHTLTLMITVIVVAAPEGLPMMIAVVLSSNIKKII